MYTKFLRLKINIFLGKFDGDRKPVTSDFFLRNFLKSFHESLVLFLVENISKC